MDRDGLFFTIPFLAISIICFYFSLSSLSMPLIYCGLAAFLVAAFMAFFFRDPERKTPADAAAVFAPADGRIVEVVDENGFRRISIFLSIFDVHVNRIPVSGKVSRIERKQGKFLAAFKPEASRENEQCEIEIESDYGTIITRQIAGVLARRIVCRLKTGQPVKAGERFGLIRFGSRIDILLPATAEPIVSAKQKVKAGISILARFR